jgi:hypothetical protein
MGGKRQGIQIKNEKLKIKSGKNSPKGAAFFY